MKRGMGPDDVAAFIDMYLARKYSRQLDRFFAGTIVTVTGTGPFTCTVQRTGETAADGNTYLCATPRYRPAVGDLVDCMWRDNATGYVLWPLTAASAPAIGTLAYVQLTLPTAAIVAETTVLTAPSVSVGSGRRIRITVFFPYFTITLANDTFDLRIKEGTAQLTALGIAVPQGGTPLTGGQCIAVVTPTAGGHIFSATLVRTSGAGSIIGNADPAHPAFMVVEDIT